MVKHNYDNRINIKTATTTTITTTTDATDTANRPRRPSPDTIAYLRSLPLDYESTRADIRRYQDYLLSVSSPSDTNEENETTIDVEFPTSLAVAIQAIYEIRHEMASIAGDECGANVIELLCHIAIPVSPTICRIILQAIGGGGGSGTHQVSQYAVHLATHRYGSHVLQTILQLSSQHCYTTSTTTTTTTTATTTTSRDIDLALHADAPVVPSNNSSSASRSSGGGIDDDDDDDGDDESTTMSILDHIRHIASTLHPVATELMVHICGSHCLRTILCILGNVTMTTTSSTSSSSTTTNALLPPQPRRGKLKSSKKKKKKTVDHNEPHDTGRNPLNEPRMMYASSSPHVWSPPTPEMMDLLRKFTSSLTAAAPDETTFPVGPGPLQSWACHASAGPVIAVLLQVWTYCEYATDPTDGAAAAERLRQQQYQWEVQQTTQDRHLCLPRPEPHYPVGSMTDTIVRRLLCWRNEMEEQTYGSDVLYGYAGEPRGSHCLETILRLAPDAVHEQILIRCHISDTAATMKEYIHDTVSNFVLQTMLQTIRTLDQATVILSAMAPHMAYLLDPIHKRRWIVWRMVELAGRYADCQGMVIHLITNGCTTLRRQQQQQQQQQAATSTSTMSRNNAASDNVTMKLNKCISMFLNIVPPKEHGDRVGVDIAGTRMVYHMLQYQTEFCSDTIKGIMELSSNDMELLLKDPFVSRCLFDELMISSHLERNDRRRHHSMFRHARKRLVAKLQNRWVGVATDRVGYHMIQRLFHSLDDINDKKTIVDELIIGKNRMNSNSMGRNVLESLQVRTYEMNGEQEWINTMKRQISKQEWLDEIIDTKKETTKKKNHRNDSVTDMVADTGGDTSATTTTKPKRNRTVHDRTTGDDDDDDDDHAVHNIWKKQRVVSKSVDAIMDAISIPKQQ